MTKHLTTAWLLVCVLVAPAPSAPPVRPQIGLGFRAQYVRARDADTIEVRIPGSAYVWALRLIDVWAPETDAANPDAKKLALAGKAFVKRACENEPTVTVFIPFDKIGAQPLKALTFDRIPSWVWLDKSVLTLNEMVVLQGYASSTKGGELGR